MMIGISLVVSVLASIYIIPIIAKKTKKQGIVGKDMNKKERPEIPEMVGLALVIGMVAGFLAFHIISQFSGGQPFDAQIYAGMMTIIMIAAIGAIDDIIRLTQKTKFVATAIASAPLILTMLEKSGIITVPFIGYVDFGIFYALFWIPIGFAVAPNLTNILAGFNGMEAGMGSVMFFFLSLISYLKGMDEVLIFSLPMLGALLAFYWFSKYPSRVFMGDVGTMSIGACLTVAIIVGDFELLGIILVIPYLIDLIIKAYNRFPSTNWWGELHENKLRPVDRKIRGFAQLIMKLTGGIEEKKLVAIFIIMEFFCGLVAYTVFIIFDGGILR